MADVQQAEEWDKLQLDLEKLTEQNLEELAFLVSRKLLESMRQERDRAGRF